MLQSCLIKPNVWCAAKWPPLSKHFKSSRKLHLLCNHCIMCAFHSHVLYLGPMHRHVFWSLFSFYFPVLQKQSLTQTKTTDPKAYEPRDGKLFSLLVRERLCAYEFLSVDKQTTDAVLEKVKVARARLKWGRWEATSRRYSNGGVIFNFASIKQGAQPSPPRYLIKYFTHYISFVLPAVGSEW